MIQTVANITSSQTGLGCEPRAVLHQPSWLNIQNAISILCLFLCVFEDIYVGDKCVSTILVYVFNKHGEQDWIMLTECSSPVPVRKRCSSWGKKSAGNCCIIRSFINLFIPGKPFTVLHLLVMDFSTVCNRIWSGFRQKICNRNFKSCLWGPFL